MASTIGHRSRWDIARIHRDVIEKSNVSPMIAHLLFVRGYRDAMAIEGFIESPIFEHDPLLIPDMEKAVKRIKKAIKKKEKIGIYGDFDTDGLTSSAIVFEFFKEQGIIPEVIIPHRREGHGIASFRLKQLQDAGVTLLITVDNGVTSIEEVKEAKSMNMDVIVTDHHEPRLSGELPGCLVVNPNRHDSKYPFNGLCGAGVAYKLVSAVAGERKENMLDLVALGTVADVVPIRDENRGFVMRGLEQMKKERRIGLTALLYACDVDFKRLNSTTVAFYIAPRINAANRLADPRLAYEMLVADSFDEAGRVAAQLGDLNDIRKRLIEEYSAKLIKEIGDPATFTEAVENKLLPPLLVVKGDWLPGLSGVICPKLVEVYGVPVFCASTNDEYGKISASGRSIPGVSLSNILEAAQAAGARFHKHGGHAGAAGFVIEPDKFDVAVEKLKEASISEVGSNSTGSVIKIDAEIPFGRVNMYACSQIEKLGPFGQTFPEPMFLSRCVNITKQKQIGVDGKHLSFTISDGDNSIRGVMFGHDPEVEDIPEDRPIDIVYNMEANAFRGFATAEVRVKDWQFSDNCDTLKDGGFEI